MFEICADAPASAGPESASNTVTRIREDFLGVSVGVRSSCRYVVGNISLLGGLSHKSDCLMLL